MFAQKQVSRYASLAAPVGGWNARDAVATMPPLDAVTMLNVWPATSDVMLRKGFTEWASGMTGQVESILAYQGTTKQELFSVCNNQLFDITATGPVGAAEVSGLTNSRFQYVNNANAGGSYLMAVNGEDTPLLYDGTTWGNTAITGFTQANAIQINLFKNRVWLIEKDTLKAWYLPVDAIAGAATALNFQSVATKGGYLMAMATWTVDSGQGSDDYAVFVTSEGELIVYQGTDPSSITTWALKGVYQVGSPIGRRCFIKFGGDLLLICYDGVLPMSKALQSSIVDKSASITNKIQGAMSEAASLYAANFGWQLDYCPNNSRVMLNVPVSTGNQEQFAMNTITGSWARFTGLNANVWEQYQNESYFGGDGVVNKFWDGYNDNGDEIVGDVLQAFSTFGSPGLTKRWSMGQLFFSVTGAPTINAYMNVDYDTSSAGVVSPTVSPVIFGQWDSGLWDAAIWGGGLNPYNPKIGLTALGKSGAMHLLMVSDQLEIRWQATNFVYETGGFL